MSTESKAMSQMREETKGTYPKDNKVTASTVNTTQYGNNQLARDGDEDLSALARNSLSLEEKLGKDPADPQENDSAAAGSRTASSTQRNTNDTGASETTEKGPLVSAEPTETETEIIRHDTTIHRTVKPPVIHETIRPIETNIITTNITVHRHVHHYVHRIQPVLVTSDEEERLVHNIMGEGREPTTSMTYRQLGGSATNDVGTGGGMGGGKVCQVCGGATRNVLYREKGVHSGENELEQDISGDTCPICGRNTDNLSRGMEGMNIRD